MEKSLFSCGSDDLAYSIKEYDRPIFIGIFSHFTIICDKMCLTKGICHLSNCDIGNITFPVFWMRSVYCVMMVFSALHEILVHTDRVGAKSPIFYLFSLVEPQPYDIAKTVQLTLVGSPLRTFQ